MKMKHKIALGVAGIAAVSGIAGASINAIWGSNDVVNVYNINGEKMILDNQAVQEMINENDDLAEQNNEYKKNLELLSSEYKDLEEDSQNKESEISKLEEENEGLKTKIEDYEKQVEELKLENDNLVKENKEQEEDITNDHSKENEGLIWDVLPSERLNATKVCLPSEGEPFIMSGEKCYGVYVESTWGGNNNIYLYLNHEFSDVSFKIGHIDKTEERDTQVKILLDENIYEEPYTVTYSEQPKEFNLSGLEDIGTLLINIDNGLDGGGYGPSYGITEIYLKKIEQ